MAGWDHEIDVDERDLDLLLNCFKLLRRTCARHRVEFSYYRYRSRTGTRLRYVMAYNLQSVDMPGAAAEFAIEMRALSPLETVARRRRLPLRILRDVAWHASYPVTEQLDEPDSPVPDDLVLETADLLTAFERSWHSWRTRVLSDADFVEAQHSLVIGLALLFGAGALTTDNYPTLVEKLSLDQAITEALKRLGANRRTVKHLGTRENARQFAEEGLPWVLRLISTATGVYIDPLAPDVALMGVEPQSVFKRTPMFWRSAEPRIVRR